MIASEVIIFLYNNEGFQLQMNLVQSYYETNIRREIGRRPVYVGIIFPGPIADREIYTWRFRRAMFIRSFSSDYDGIASGWG